MVHIRIDFKRIVDAPAAQQRDEYRSYRTPTPTLILQRHQELACLMCCENEAVTLVGAVFVVQRAGS
jgi:hypothetical protein